MNDAKRTARILVVDDEERNRRLLAAMIQTDGYSIAEAADGAQALERVRQDPPDIILLDVMMPGMDGYDVARALKADAATGTIPVVMVTALDDRASRLRGLEAGVEEFITKPVDRNELRVRVRNLLRLKEFNDFLAHHNEILKAQVVERTAELEAANRSLREREEHSRAITQSAHDAIITSDSAGNIAGWNRGAAIIFGYTDAEAMGRPTTLLMPERYREAHLAGINRLRSGAGPRLAGKPIELHGLRQDGSEFPLEITLARWESATGWFVTAIIRDITEKRRAQDEIRHYVAELKTAFMSTVVVATTLGEMRDPYTAGHQRRVAEVAVAIGAELGFDERRQEGLRVAGFLHDIGKITIPAELLTKPGKLGALEFELIKGHSQSGYEVLKDVTFPWPVAEVARQHHERMDGSGYPRGLKGEEILIEARIMAVADVVEAMSSHRPYRAGLGIDKALAEIERGRGTLYDPVVADACLKIFREKGYVIPG